MGLLRRAGSKKQLPKAYYVISTPDSIFGDVPDLDSRNAGELVADREKWKRLRPQTIANLYMGICSKKK